MGPTSKGRGGEIKGWRDRKGGKRRRGEREEKKGKGGRAGRLAIPILASFRRRYKAVVTSTIRLQQESDVIRWREWCYLRSQISRGYCTRSYEQGAHNRKLKRKSYENRSAFVQTGRINDSFIPSQSRHFRGDRTVLARLVNVWTAEYIITVITVNNNNSNTNEHINHRNLVKTTVTSLDKQKPKLYERKKHARAYIDVSLHQTWNSINTGRCHNQRQQLPTSETENMQTIQQILEVYYTTNSSNNRLQVYIIIFP